MLPPNDETNVYMKVDNDVVVNVSQFRDKAYVDIRKCETVGGKFRRTYKGITLNAYQWGVIMKKAQKVTNLLSQMDAS